MMNITTVFGKQSSSGKAAALFGAPQAGSSGEAAQNPSAMLTAVPEFLQILLAQIQQSVQPQEKPVPQETTLFGMKHTDSDGSSGTPPADPAVIPASGNEASGTSLTMQGVTSLLQWNRSTLQSLNAKPVPLTETAAVNIGASTETQVADQQTIRGTDPAAGVSPSVFAGASALVTAGLPSTASSEPLSVIPDEFPVEAFQFPVTGNGVLFTDEKRSVQTPLRTVQNIPFTAGTIPSVPPAADVNMIPVEAEKKQGSAAPAAEKNVPAGESIPATNVHAEAHPVHSEKPELRPAARIPALVNSERVTGTQTETVPGKTVSELLNRFPAAQITIQKQTGPREASPSLNTAAAEVMDAHIPKNIETVKRSTAGTDTTGLRDEEAKPSAAEMKQVQFKETALNNGSNGSEQGSPQHERSGQQLTAEPAVTNTVERPAALSFEKAMATPAVSAEVRTVGRTAPLTAPPEPVVVPSLMEQLSRNIDMAIKSDRSEMKMTLNPETLGEVIVRVHVEDGKVNASLDVQQSQVKHIIESNMPQLREALTAKGLTMERIEVTTAQQGTADDMAQQQQGGGKKKRQWNDVMEDEESSMKTLGYNTIEITM